MNLLHQAGAFVRLSVLSALCLFGIAASAQTTTITASQQQWGGTWLTQGTVSLIPVTPDGNPQAFSANGKFYPPASRNNFSSGFTGTVVKGALTANVVVPDKTSVSASYPLCYDVQLRNDLTGQVADIGVRCDITGTTVSLDNYVPPVVAPGYVVGYTHGVLAAMPAHCAAGAQYGADDTYAVYFCGLDGTFHAPAGGGGSATPATSTALGTVKLPVGQTSTQLGTVAITNSYSDLLNKPTIPSVTTASISAAIQGATGCGTAGYVYVPASNICVAQSAGGTSLPSTTSLFKGNNSGGAVAAVPDTDYATPSGVASAVSAEAVLARNANNLNSGTIPVAQLPSIPTSKIAATIIYASKLSGISQNVNLLTGANKTGSGNATDDAAILQAALNTASVTNPVRLVQDGQSLLTATLTIPSYAEIDCLNRSNGFFMANGAGATVIRIGSGPSSPTDPQIAAPAQGTSAGMQNCFVNGNRGNGTVGNSQNGNYRGTGNYTSIYVNNYTWLFDVDIINMQNVWLRNNVLYNAPTYSVRTTNVSHALIEGNRFQPFADGAPVTSFGNTDGVHIDGPALDFRVIGNSGRTGDDFVALNAPEGYGGPISNIIVSHNVCELCLSFSRIYSGSIAPPSGAATATISGVVMSNNTATTLHTGFIVGLESGRAVSTVDATTDVNLIGNTIHGGCNYAWLLDNIGTLSISKGDWYSPLCDGSVTGSTGSYLISGLTPATFRSVSVADSRIIRDGNGSSATMFLDNFGKIYNQTPGTAVFKNLSVSGFGMADAGGSSYGVGSMFNIKAGSVTNIALGANDYTLMQLSPAAIYNAGATQSAMRASGLNLGQCSIFGIASCYDKGFALYDDGTNLDSVDLVPGAFRITTDGSGTAFDFGYGNYARTSRTSLAQLMATGFFLNVPVTSTGIVSTLKASSVNVDQISAGNSRVLALGANTATPGILHLVAASSNASVYKDALWDGTTFYLPGVLQLPSSATPTCNATNRFVFNTVAGASGAKDVVQVCAKDATDAYAWRSLY